MGYYRVVGVGTQASAPIEHVVSTATEAEQRSVLLRRLCGQLGTVEVWLKNGRKVSSEQIQRLARAERSGTERLLTDHFD